MTIATSDPVLIPSGYFSKHGFALIPLRAGSKAALESGWPDNASTDPAQWEAWRAAGYNLGIHAGASRLVIVDLDTTKTGGRDGAWRRYSAWCTANDLPTFAPHCSTGREGLHVYFKIPSGVNVATLKGSDLAEGVNVLCHRHYAVAPTSLVDGRPYALYPDAPPHEAPAALIQHCTPENEPAATEGNLTDLDARRVADLVRWLAENDAFEAYEDWVSVGMALASQFGSDGLEIWRLAHNETVTSDVEAAKWRSFDKEPQPGAVTLATWLKRAWQLGWTGNIGRSVEAMFADVVVPVITSPPIQSADTEITKDYIRSRRFGASSLHGEPVPQRQWLVRDLIPARNVTLLYGDGGTGKSLVVLQLAVAVVTNKPFFGHLVQQGGVEFLTAEDDKDELHRRLADITRESGVSLDALGDLKLSSLADGVAILAVAADGGMLTHTDIYTELDQILSASRPALLVLDTLADVYGGNEIVRSQVRQFVGMLRHLCIKHGCAIVVLAHPSLSGMDKGTSGSTGWNNSVRSRLYFQRVLDTDGTEPDPDARVLKVLKSNYGRVGLEIPMRWRAGAFALMGGMSNGDPLVAQAKADRVFLELLAKARTQNIDVHVSTGRGYAPDVFKADAVKQGVNRAQLADAMRRLHDAGRIINAPYGPPSRIRHRLQIEGGA